MTGDANVDRALGVLNLIQTQYPQLLPLLKVNPDIMRIFTDVYANPAAWPPERINAAVMNTPWFLNTPAPQRQFALLSALDPATARQNVGNVEQLVKMIAGQIGIPPNKIDTMMVLQATAEQWSETRIRMELVARMDPNAIGAGDIGAMMTDYNGLAAQYGVKLNPNDLKWWAMNTVGGSVTANGFRDFLIDQAVAQYPVLKPILEQGMTTQQFMAPYFATAAEELGINPNLLMAANPHWVDIVIGHNEKGQFLLSQGQMIRKIRSDPSYGYDNGMPAIEKASQFADQLMTMFGAKG